MAAALIDRYEPVHVENYQRLFPFDSPLTSQIKGGEKGNFETSAISERVRVLVTSDHM